VKAKLTVECQTCEDVSSIQEDWTEQVIDKYLTALEKGEGEIFIRLKCPPCGRYRNTQLLRLRKVV
jgi:hypothetical protein